MHTCPGRDQDSVHSLDVDQTELLPELFKIEARVRGTRMAAEKLGL